MSHTGQYLRQLRYDRSLRLGDVARLLRPNGEMSSRGAVRTCNRLVAIERGEIVDNELARLVANALQGNPDTFNELVQLDVVEQEAVLQAYLAEPVAPALHVRPFSGFWFVVPLPTHIATEEEAINFVVDLSATQPFDYVVSWSRRKQVLIRDARVVQHMEVHNGFVPHMEIGGTHFHFVASDFTRR